MPASVPAIDSVLLKKDPVADPSGISGLAAFAYFKEPRDEINYYLLQLNEPFNSGYDQARQYNYEGGSIFPFYVFDDKTLPAYVEGMEVLTLLAYSISSRLGPYWIIRGDSVQVRLSSLTRNTYEYFSALSKQFLDDGNAYKPGPASAVGNISGGALGLFWAANISGMVTQH